jgi:hypothetical protein
VYVDNPYEVIRPSKIQPAPKVDPRLLAFAQEGQGAGRGHNVGKPQRGFMPTNVCLYMGGRHVHAGDNCPHFREEPVDSARQVQEEPIIFRPMKLRPS